MTMLNAGTLESLDGCYVYDQRKFIADEMQRKLSLLDKYYSPALTTTIKHMLNLTEDLRPDFLELSKSLTKQTIPPSTYNSIQR